MSASRRNDIEVYVFRRRGRRVEFLCLRRSPRERLPGVWQPVTGSVRPSERFLEAAVREVREETGLAPLRWWALETVSVYYDAGRDAVRLLPMFAAEAAPAARVVRSREHDDHAWISRRAFAARVLWGMQRRGLDAVRREVLGNPRLAAALEVTGAARAPKAKARAKAVHPRARRAARH